MSNGSDKLPEYSVTHVQPDILRSMYTVLYRIRAFEEKVANELSHSESEIIGPVHLYIGQEAIATGACAGLRNDDYVFSTHRSHGHYIAKGGNIKSLMAEIYCRATGCSRGRGGSMHLSESSIGLPGSSAIVGGTIPLAVGAALAFTLRKEDSVALVFFGDGASNEGVFYESLNIASLYKLPVVFFCENNLYATHMPISACMADTNIYRKAEMFCLPGIRIDGNNVVEVYDAVLQATERARKGEGPSLIEGMTYRWRGHVGPNYDIDKGLRSQKELDDWMEKDPLKLFEGALLRDEVIPKEELGHIREVVNREVEEALAFAKESPFPGESELLDNVFKK